METINNHEQHKRVSKTARTLLIGVAALEIFLGYKLLQTPNLEENCISKGETLTSCNVYDQNIGGIRDIDSIRELYSNYPKVIGMAGILQGVGILYLGLKPNNKEE